jgi:ATP-binding protein involved in chromosome partitioning
MPVDPIDPRVGVIAERLAGVGRVIGVTGSKGGIGKSVVAATTALALADRGRAVGLLDLDFASPSGHVVLGVDRSFPGEEFGIDPHVVHGIHLMSVAFFSGDTPVPWRGDAATSALLELLAITRWGDLDVLILDMPPGLGDTTLDVIRLVPRLEFLLVGNASRVVVASVRRALRLFTELGLPLVGALENMRRGGSGIESLAAEFDVPFLGAIPFDETLEDALGNPDRLRQTAVYRELAEVLPEIPG